MYHQLNRRVRIDRLISLVSLKIDIYEIETSIDETETGNVP